MNDDKFTIHLKIAGGTYPLRIKRDEEEVMRKAANLVNKKLATYREQFGGDKTKSMQDFLSMTALNLSYAYLKLMETRDVDVFTDMVRELNDELEGYLKQE